MSYRYGEPLTEEQRQQRHMELTGEQTPPPRGTGRATTNPEKSKLSIDSSTLFWVALLAHLGILGVELWVAHKQGWV